MGVVDATNLTRNLYLVLQLLELSIPTVVALNMIDELPGPPPDTDVLSALLSVPVVPISARTRQGIDGLRIALVTLSVETRPGTIFRISQPKSTNSLSTAASTWSDCWARPNATARSTRPTKAGNVKNHILTALC